MLFFLMKIDRKLWFRVLVLALIVAVEILPRQTVGALKCYKCNSMKHGSKYPDDVPCGSKRNKIVDCNRGGGYCRSKREDYGKGEVVSRDCEWGSAEIQEVNYKCYHEKFPGGCYINNYDSFDKISECTTKYTLGSWRMQQNEKTEEGKGRSSYDEEFKYKQTLEHCHCKTDLCNGPPGITDGDPTTTTPDPDEIEYGPRSSGVMTASHGRLILVGVTVLGVLVAASASRVMSVRCPIYESSLE